MIIDNLLFLNYLLLEKFVVSNNALKNKDETWCAKGLTKLSSLTLVVGKQDFLWVWVPDRSNYWG